MASTETMELPSLGQDGEPCESCGAPLAADQRYCLECGARRGESRVPFAELNGNGASTAPAAASAASDRDVSPMGAVIGIAILGVMLLVGVLIGRGGGDDSTPVVTVGGAGPALAGAAGAGETVSNTGEVKSEWPAGTDGWTVELGTLPKDGTDAAAVEAAKADVETKGASDVGVLDSDLYASLPTGNYVIYSGVFDAEGDAKKALSDLEADFPDAQVVEVSEKAASGGGGGGGGTSDGSGLVGGQNAGDSGIVEASEADIAALDEVTGDDYQDALKKLPDQIETPGKPPPKKPGEIGAGTEVEAID
jgi:hypothetical protein